MADQPDLDNTRLRKEWIGLLGCADPSDLETEKRELTPQVNTTYIVRPESGMIMVQASQDGAGQRFNLGEATVSRCILQLDGQYLGYGMVMGSDLEHAELAAFFDALFQMPGYGDTLNRTLIPKLREKAKKHRERAAKETRATKVEFFTLKRGE